MKDKKKLQSTADKFSSLFDQDWKQTKSRLRTRDEERRVYDPSTSWDAMSDNPDRFSRLDQTLVPYQKTKPIVLSGAAVVELEDNLGFTSINVHNPSQSNRIPLTVEQKDIQMAPDLSGTTPLASFLNDPNKILVLEKKSGFKNQNTDAPEIKAIPRPEYMSAAGREADQVLLTPAQRREINFLTAKEREAREYVRKAASDRVALRKQMSGPVFNRGVLMVDSAANINSEVYGDKAIQDLADKEYKRHIKLERASRLGSMNGAMHIHGNILVPDTLGPRVKVEKEYQSKGGDFHALSYEETHNRLFMRMQGASSSNRAQNLRDLDLSGKEYNITQHTLIEHWPAREVNRIHDKRLSHHSQNTLEGQRLMQGSIRPF